MNHHDSPEVHGNELSIEVGMCTARQLGKETKLLCLIMDLVYALMGQLLLLVFL